MINTSRLAAASRSGLQSLYSFLKACSSVSGGILALFVLQSFLFPRVIWQPLQAWAAKRNGLVGYVYYEIDRNRGLTDDGQLFLLTDSSQALYNDIRVGDRLIANSEVYFHLKPGSSTPKMYTLREGECVIVLDKPRNEVKVKKALSGGYLYVATTSCGIF
ncbi:MAG: hypothetical protein GPJ11_03345 [Microcystis aeruginosa L211-101]|jgi:hypothetical protein|nr:hypothetical protein [Microcystis aeruginosa L211-11]NCR29995.1 hypothetical protein [Microcystis aeruginosa L211-101]